MKNNLVALMISGEPGSTRNALTEEKYKQLAVQLAEKGFHVDSVVYHDANANKLEKELLKYNAILVWVNPIEQGRDRRVLDQLLRKIAGEGCYVSSHPDTILKIGTKEILYKIKDAEFGVDTRMYRTTKEFQEGFLKDAAGIRVLKKYRGNGGNGVFKIDTTNGNMDLFKITHAAKDGKEEFRTRQEFFSFFAPYFADGAMLIDQAWNPNLINGMVRCYLSGSKVTGFGYQEINALYPQKKPSQRFYLTEDCGLFQDLRKIMETKWVSQLQQIAELEDKDLPVIWDADFFIDDLNTENAAEKYSLCEINVSSVSPFPESSVPYMVDVVCGRTRN